MAQASLVYPPAEGKAASEALPASFKNLNFAYFEGGAMDCTHFFQPKEKGDLVRATGERDSTKDARTVIRELEGQKEKIVFETTTEAMVRITMQDQSVVSSTKDVRVVLTTSGGPHCWLYLVQVLITFKCKWVTTVLCSD